MGQPAPIYLEDELTEPKAAFNIFIPVGKPIDWVANIAEMHNKHAVNSIVRALDPKRLRDYLQFRIDFLQEELDEMIEATWDSDYKRPDNRAEDVVDALIDLCVVAIGTLNAFDVDAHEAWSRVHEKNMQKESGVNESRPNEFGFPDMIKPKDWTAPTHADNVGLLSRIFS